MVEVKQDDFFFPFENVVFLNIDNFGIFPKKESGGIKIKILRSYESKEYGKKKKGEKSINP